jgi:hypothetical protein
VIRGPYHDPGNFAVMGAKPFNRNGFFPNGGFPAPGRGG